jgi:hypothetical protein
VTVGIAAMKHRPMSPNTNHERFLPVTCGNVSQTPVMTDSKPPNYTRFKFNYLPKKVYVSNRLTVLSIPRVKSIKKNITAHSGAHGIRLIAWGYVIKMSPGPGSVTSWIVLPWTWAICPSVEKTTKPDRMLVKQFIKLVSRASL